ncbi:hypothetical protein SAMN05444003_1983 [Cognatiyoonia sediminum]|uniref:Uncharacterized protein n=1 Tax=Cognatiyoonia sediminum TaxID=1508389 RepID=A0A1M5Q187_9RHOB|nr:hypothetical protein [Cognatiyoonia sediminum]SHH07895.1 hypothetical protein SAMN05444003_1983 [Cognatiyoonia sediminum]
MRLTTEQSQVFQELGWSIRKDAIGDPMIYRVDGDQLFEVVFQYFERGKQFYFPLLYRATTVSYRQSFLEVTARKSTENAPIFGVVEFHFADTSHDVMQDISQKLIGMADKADVASEISRLSQTRPSTLEGQYEYLTALAWLGQYDRLKLELEALKLKNERENPLKCSVDVFKRIDGMDVYAT